MKESSERNIVILKWFDYLVVYQQDKTNNSLFFIFAKLRVKKSHTRFFHTEPVFEKRVPVFDVAKTGFGAEKVTFSTRKLHKPLKMCRFFTPKLHRHYCRRSVFRSRSVLFHHFSQTLFGSNFSLHQYAYSSSSSHWSLRRREAGSFSPSSSTPP